MNPTEALDLTTNGGTLVVLDAPVGLQLGIDTNIFHVGPIFKGIKMIPPNIIHMVHYRYGDSAHAAFFCIFNPGEVIVRRWDARWEDFAEGSGMTLEDVERLTAAVHRLELDKNLGPYPVKDTEKWLKLSNYITSYTLDKAGIPLGTPIVPEDTETLEEGMESRKPLRDRGKATDTTGSNVIPYFPGQNRTAHLTSLTILPQHLAALSPSQRTGYFLEGNQRLDLVLQHEYNCDPHKLFGETQLAYVLLMYLSSLNALEFWKDSVSMICTCSHDKLIQDPDLFATFVTILQHQLSLADRDFFMDQLTRGSFLRQSLISLFNAVDTAVADNVRNAMLEMSSFLMEKFSFDISDAAKKDEQDDDADVPLVITSRDEAVPAVTEEGDAAFMTRRTALEHALDTANQ